MTVWKAEQWESVGRYHVNSVQKLSSHYSNWYTQAVIWGLPADKFAEMLHDKYHATGFKYRDGVLIWHFTCDADARKYKNDINKKARERKFYID